MVEVFREVRRVLTKTGTLWLNLGDSYLSRPDNFMRDRRGHNSMLSGLPGPAVVLNAPHRKPQAGIKPKDMIGIPWRVAFALQADGWYLRSDIIWSKPNPMPESVTDRPTKAHEYVFLLTKSARYYYDAQAIAEPVSENTHMRVSQDVARQIGSFRANGGAKTNGPMKAHPGRFVVAPKTVAPGLGIKNNTRFSDAVVLPVNARNARTVWTIATQPYHEAHFATFPEELPRRAILAGCPEQVCATCGKPRERITKTEYANPGNRTTNAPRSDERKHIEHGTAGYAVRLEARRSTTGWSDCGHANYRAGIVLDPFAGSGTTLAVARDLGRRSIGIELNPEYVRLIEKRCAQQALPIEAGA